MTAAVIACTAIAAGCVGFVIGGVIAVSADRRDQARDVRERDTEVERLHAAVAARDTAIADLTAEANHLHHALDEQRRRADLADEILAVVSP